MSETNWGAYQMPYVFAVLMLVFLTVSVHGQSPEDLEYIEVLEGACVFGDDDACDELDELEAQFFSPGSLSSDGRTASLMVCNRTPDKVYVAIANDVGPADGDEFRSRGWWTLESGVCDGFWSWRAGNVDDVPLFFLVYAESDSGTTWSGDDAYLCAPDSKFDITGNHDFDCEKRGYFDIDIFEGDRLRRGYTIDLTL